MRLDNTDSVQPGKSTPGLVHFRDHILLWYRKLQWYSLVILYIRNVVFQSYFLDIETLEACFRLLHMMTWCMFFI